MEESTMSFLDNLYRLSQVEGEAESQAEEAAKPAVATAAKPAAQVQDLGENLPKILLIDDDPIFGKIMERTGKQLRLDITFCQSVAELGAIEDFDFDVAIIDYDLGAVTGYELTSYLSEYAGNVPVVLISNNADAQLKGWAQGITQFVHKKLGPYSIFKAAVLANTNKAQDNFGGKVH
jgi:CheY-like chemotaxis protein